MGRFPVPTRSRLLAVLLVGLTACAVVGLFLSAAPRAAAQEKKEEEKKSDDKGEGGGSKPNLLMHIIKSAGPVFGPLLLLVSIALVALIVLLAMDLRLPNAIPPGFVEDFTDTVNKRQFKAAYEMAREDGSYLGRVMTTGMARLQYGIEDAREAAFAMVENIKASKEQLITYLATIGTLGPLLGLVGTVFGMIMSFMELSGGGEPKAADLAKGISHALVVTLLGIALSVPAIFCHAFFRNRLIRMSLDVANIADDLLTQMYHNSKKPAAGGAGGAGAAALAGGGGQGGAALAAQDAAAVADARAGAAIKQK
jgi:biopolymer transport protein ExbB